MVVICVTGTPGAGKSTFAKKLSLSIGYAYFNVSDFIKKHDLGEQRGKSETLEVDVGKLTSALLRELKGDVVVDSHLSHYLPKEKVRLCVVMRTQLKELKARLDARGYAKEKVRENLDAEIFDVCGEEARDFGHTVLEFDSTSPSDDQVQAFINKIKDILH